MELPQIGDRCQRADCQRLDFLPVVCPKCSVQFCGDHFPPEKHDCAGVALVSESTPQLKAVKDFVTCTLCPERSAVENLCLNCKKHFCIIHRHHGCADPTKEELDREREKWNAPKRQFAAAKQRADVIIEAKLRKAANPTALKVQLMRLKQRAEGPKSVPTDERAYFSVDGAALFVSRRAPLGRLLDQAVTKLRLPSAATLSTDDGPLPNDQTVQALLDAGRIAEGQTLTLS